MPQFRSQRIHTVLFGDPEIESPTTVTSSIFVPIHTHDHGSMTGLLDDDHPQYTTDSRAVDIFTALFQQVTDKTNAANIGGGIGWFIRKNNSDLEFKTLTAGANVTISEVGNEVVIEASGGGSDGGGY